MAIYPQPDYLATNRTKSRLGPLMLKAKHQEAVGDTEKQPNERRGHILRLCAGLAVAAVPIVLGFLALIGVLP